MRNNNVSSQYRACSRRIGLSRPSSLYLHGKRRGFSFLEILIIVLVMGIIAAVAVPKYAESMGRYRVEVTALRLASDLKRARQDAITSSAGRTVNIDVASNNYTVPGLPSLDHPDQDHLVNLGDAPYYAALISADFGGTPNLVFDLYGSPVSGGEIQIGSGAYTKVIKVDSETGKISVP